MSWIFRQKVLIFTYWGPRWFFYYAILFVTMCGFLINLNYHLNSNSIRTTSNDLSSSISVKKQTISLPMNELIPPTIIIDKTYDDHDSMLQSDLFDSAGVGLWPEENKDSDRIIEQFRYRPQGYDIYANPKLILLPKGVYPNWANMGYGKRGFEVLRCPVSNCYLTDKLDPARNESESILPDALLYRDSYPSADELKGRTRDQIWIFYSLESPMYRNEINWTKIGDTFNWTATYRRDSDIVTPYDKYVARFDFLPGPGRGELLTDQQITSAILKLAPLGKLPIIQEELFALKEVLSLLYLKPTVVNYAESKDKMVAWFVSNCDSYERLIYALELEKYIGVDRYGDCSVLKCDKSQMPSCYEMLDKRYKFYLSFENSRCRDYITEKFFEIGLKNKIVPIVMGARREDYERIAPHQSFIHVDDFGSASDLATYLHVLASNPHLYNSYLAWKEMEGGTFVNTKFWCRLCAMLHYPLKRRFIQNFYSWWNGPGVCDY